jgi:hypothetical protein
MKTLATVIALSLLSSATQAQNFLDGGFLAPAPQFQPITPVFPPVARPLPPPPVIMQSPPPIIVQPIQPTPQMQGPRTTNCYRNGNYVNCTTW